jgi:hypothetical protein
LRHIALLVQHADHIHCAFPDKVEHQMMPAAQLAQARQHVVLRRVAQRAGGQAFDRAAQVAEIEPRLFVAPFANRVVGDVLDIGFGSGPKDHLTHRLRGRTSAP